MRHSGVREAALIGLPDPELGDRPVVYVTLREGPVGSAEVVKFAEAELGRDLPGLSVEAVDAMPMTPTGKISKAQLKAQAGAQVATPSGPA